MNKLGLDVQVDGYTVFCINNAVQLLCISKWGWFIRDEFPVELKPFLFLLHFTIAGAMQWAFSRYNEQRLIMILLISATYFPMKRHLICISLKCMSSSIMKILLNSSCLSSKELLRFFLFEIFISCAHNPIKQFASRVSKFPSTKKKLYSHRSCVRIVVTKRKMSNLCLNIKTS